MPAQLAFWFAASLLFYGLAMVVVMFFFMQCIGEARFDNFIEFLLYVMFLIALTFGLLFMGYYSQINYEIIQRGIVWK